MGKVMQYLRETRGEMKHVSWPTRKQALINTVLVILLSILVALLLGFFDFVFSKLLDIFIIR
ncbi:MAG TPA: preprotein translocase subunit SecE [Candidatus Paceibacterota bacterium]